MKLTTPRILTAIGFVAFFMYSVSDDFYGSAWGFYLEISVLSFLAAAIVAVARASRKQPPN